MKTIATIAVSLLLSLGLFVSPASAEETVPVEPAAECVQRAPDAEVIADPQADRTLLLDAHIATLETQQQIADKTIRQLGKKLERREATIERLRKELRSR